MGKEIDESEEMSDENEDAAGERRAKYHEMSSIVMMRPCQTKASNENNDNINRTTHHHVVVAMNNIMKIEDECVSNKRLEHRASAPDVRS